jgi:hypothetical protein
MDVESGTWVTVFGFPPSQASYVLKLFQEIGEVVRHKTPLGQCNWMHIQYVVHSLARERLSHQRCLLHWLIDRRHRWQVPDKDTGTTSALEKREDVWRQPDGGRDRVH